MGAVAHRIGRQDPQVRRVLPNGGVDILFLIAAADPQIHQTKAEAWRAAQADCTCACRGASRGRCQALRHRHPDGASDRHALHDADRRGAHRNWSHRSRPGSRVGLRPLSRAINCKKSGRNWGQLCPQFLSGFVLYRLDHGLSGRPLLSSDALEPFSWAVCLWQLVMALGGVIGHVGPSWSGRKSSPWLILVAPPLMPANFPVPETKITVIFLSFGLCMGHVIFSSMRSPCRSPSTPESLDEGADASAAT
jgi:hypothetical protein